MSTIIIRATHRERAFTIDQRTIEDESLSWAARGLLSYLLSRPVAGHYGSKSCANAVTWDAMVSTTCSMNSARRGT